MSQCIRLGCQSEAWVDPENPERRSYFCIKDAWKAVNGYLLFTPKQWEVFNKEGFEDALVPEECGYGKSANSVLGTSARGADSVVFDFPDEWQEQIQHQSISGRMRAGFETHCLRCDAVIASGRKHCGKCRKALGLPEDEDSEAMVMCEHWRNELGPGHYYLRNCERYIEISRVVIVRGHRWCPSCRAYVLSISRTERLKHGYDI